jgi:hypothetical protein
MFRKTQGTPKKPNGGILNGGKRGNSRINQQKTNPA